MPKIVTAPCKLCQQPIEFDVKREGEIATCPHCGGETPLSLPVRKLEAQPVEMQPAKRRLQFIRQNSCYGVLRAVINVAAVVSIISGGLTVLIYMGANYNNFEFLAVIGVFAALLLLVLLVAAARESILSIVDIADTLLHEHSRNE